MPANTQSSKATPHCSRLVLQWLRHVTLLGSIFLGSALHAQPNPVPYDPYPGDRIGLHAFGGGCPSVELDPNRAPRIRQTGFTADPGGDPEADLREYELSYWSHIPSGQVCPLPPPMDYSSLIDIGPLPIGQHRITVIGYLDGDEFDRYTGHVWVRVRNSPRNDISGVWYAPEQSGRGLFAARRGNLTGFWWSNHDAEGRPAWVVMTATGWEGNHFEGEAITTYGPPLAPGPASIQSQRWGELAFTYIGCGRGRLEWRADDAAIGEGSLDVVQLMLPDGIALCDVSQLRTGPPAVWETTGVE